MRTLLTFFAVLLAYMGNAQHATPAVNRPDSAVDCIAYWKSGETKVYSIVHEVKTISGGSATPPFKFGYEARISIVDSTQKGYTIKWEFHLPESIMIFRPGLADSLPVYNGMKMLFTTTATGSFVGLLNWEEVRDAYIHMNRLARPKITDSIGMAAMKMAESMFNSKEQVEAAMIKEIQLFYTPFGYKFTTRGMNEKTEVSNPYGGHPFPAIQSFKAIDVDRQKDEYSLMINMQMDSVNAKSMADSILSKMNLTTDQEMQAAREKYGSFDLRDRSEYRFTRSTGWIQRIYYQRSVKMAGINKSDEYTITLKE
jgi:hypothetical protein